MAWLFKSDFQHSLETNQTVLIGSKHIVLPWLAVYSCIFVKKKGTKDQR